MTSLHRTPEAVEAGQRTLGELREFAPSLVFASLLTDDGFVVAQTRGDAIDGGRFGSMASSVQALSDAVGRELRLGSTSYVVIASSDGSHVLQLRVPGHPVILAALFDDHEMLGKALSISRRGAERLGLALDALDSSPESPISIEGIYS